MKRFAAPIALLFLCTGPAPSQAAWTTDPLQNTPVCLAPGNQRFPIMTPDGQGGAFIVFRDTRDSATALGDLYAQHLDSQGNLLWASGGVPVTTMPGEQFAAAPAIAVDGVGGAFVSFATGPNPQGGPFWVKLQHLDVQGAPLWGDSGIAVSTTAGSQINGRVLADGDGGVFISWSTDSRVLAQHFDANGAALWTPDGVVVVLSTIPQSQQMVSDGSGGLVLTWSDYRVVNASDIYAQRLDAAGVPQWTTNGVPLSTEAGQQLGLVMCSDGAGGAIAAWYTTTTSRVYARRINAGGVAFWIANGVRLTTTESGQVVPSIVSDGAGGAILAWQDLRSGGTYDGYLQRLDASGARLWGDAGLPLCDAPGMQQSFRLMSDGEGGAVAAWTDNRVPGTEDIYAQRVGPDGSPQWPVNGVLVAGASGSQRQPAMVPSGTGTIVAFADYRGSSSDIYAQLISRDGQPGVVVTGVEPDARSRFKAWLSARPLPASSHITFSFAPSAPGPFELSVFDVQGRRLQSLQGRAEGAVRHELHWDLRDDSGRRVPTGLYLARLRQGDDVLLARVVIAQ
ncbi:MAG: hypothetical protein E6K81_09700 [Candidatus Eisenbacteria bacterium]|uniref:T9SS type A sorting domain-containing protein n=1 Tax=Eiseniibacteriota bacterium TaxID=2212470 RepID=A0A538U6R8_UNCEI|nr:MAG: hypothetical protein E6K81_09700 [Candidatus Eisenbacteria bacterium]